MRLDIEEYVQRCCTCQICKNSLKIQDINQDPWHTICADTIGPCSVTTKHEKELKLLAITFCNHLTGRYKDSQKTYTAAETAKIADQV
jgi:hypothetical protein